MAHCCKDTCSEVVLWKNNWSASLIDEFISFAGYFVSGKGAQQRKQEDNHKLKRSEGQTAQVIRICGWSMTVIEDGTVNRTDKYLNVHIATVIKPDPLTNLVTNLNTLNCSGAQAAYKRDAINIVNHCKLALAMIWLSYLPLIIYQKLKFPTPVPTATAYSV
ncbi:hypothetical protein BDQ12DRAFT_665610 [Crucibulum laeve]|uniref:Uncharacterized protein n=1 Tax=Crucibulum laeve TaxID=68775 RepID=A0A5C3M3D5_9AGAR|nr:hypothetical protein BDQ12DRAFT_665610 [Crucibulum laeve]